MLNPDGHLNPDDAMSLRRMISKGELRLSAQITLTDPSHATSPAHYDLPHGPVVLANALRDLADVLAPELPAEPMEAPALAETLADAYVATIESQSAMDDTVAMDTSSRVADDLLATLGAVLASAYLEDRTRGD